MKAITFKSQMTHNNNLNILSNKAAIIMDNIINKILQVSAAVLHNRNRRYFIKNIKLIKRRDKRIMEVKRKDNLMVSI